MSDDPRSPGDPDALGAAPTLPVNDRAARRARSTARLPRGIRRRGPLLGLLLALGLVVALALLPALGSGLRKTPRNMVGISYGGGPIEAAHFQRIVAPGSGLFWNGVFDPLYLYPADTQTYIVSKTEGEGALARSDSIASPSRDRVQVEYQVAVYFKLNVDRLRSFHDELGLQYGAFRSGGWKRLIQDTFRQQVENALQEETRKYDVGEIYGDAGDLTTIQTEVEQKVSDRLVAALGQPFFCGPTYEPGGACPPPTFVIKKVEIPEGVAKAFEDNRTSQIEVLTSQNQIEQRAAEAKAIQELNAGLAQAGMPYVMLRAIESGKVSFWVLPSEGGVTLQVPQVPGEPAAGAPSGGSGEK